MSSAGSNQKCRSDQPAKLSGPSGTIAKVVTVESELGSFRCPWVIEVESGQTVTLTLVDFALWRENSSAALQGGWKKIKAQNNLEFMRSIYDFSAIIYHHMGLF